MYQLCIVVDEVNNLYDYREPKNEDSLNRIYVIVERVKKSSNMMFTIYLNECEVADIRNKGYTYDSLLIERLRGEYNKSITDKEMQKYIMNV